MTLHITTILKDEAKHVNNLETTNSDVLKIIFTLDFKSLCKTLLSWMCFAPTHICANHLRIWVE